MTAGDGDVRITLTDVFNRLERQGTEVKDTLAEIKTSIAVIVESNKPTYSDVAKLKADVSALQKRVLALPSGAVLLGLISLAVALYRK